MNYFKAILRPWFLLACSLVLLHQVTERFFDFHHWFLDSYFDPLLLMPILLHLLLWERRLFFKKGTDYVFPPAILLLYLLVASVVFELIFPLLEKRFTGDVFDVFAYSTGTLAFYLLSNKPYSKQLK